MSRAEADEAPQIPAMGGLSYLNFLKMIHLAGKPDWYLEVGTNTGTSLQLANCASIAIDPAFRLTSDVLGTKPALHLFQQTSDAAFANPALKALNAKIDVAFLDGLHHFEFLLRDLVNTEAMMSEGGIIFLHDIAPTTLELAERAYPGDGIAWAGDVWKLLPILRQYRPDLDVQVLDCTPTGLAMITGVWGQNDALIRHQDEIVAAWMNRDLAEYGIKRFYAENPLASAEFILAQLAIVTSA
jgi:predicted O-methyltransferase YrrM